MPKASSLSPRPDLDWDQIRDLVTNGLSIRDAALKFNLHPSTINWYARKQHWNVKAHRQAQRLTKLSPNGSPPKALSGHLVLARGTNAILAQFSACNTTSKLAVAVALQKATRKLAQMDEEYIINHAKELKWLADTANILFCWEGPKSSRFRPRPMEANHEQFALSPDQLAKLTAMEVQATVASPLD
jgi:transposase-like protein